MSKKGSVNQKRTDFELMNFELMNSLRGFRLFELADFLQVLGG